MSKKETMLPLPIIVENGKAEKKIQSIAGTNRDNTLSSGIG